MHVDWRPQIEPAMTDNRPPPDPAILELARIIARRMARDDAVKGIRRVWEISETVSERGATTATNVAETQSAISEMLESHTR